MMIKKKKMMRKIYIYHLKKKKEMVLLLYEEIVPRKRGKKKTHTLMATERGEEGKNCNISLKLQKRKGGREGGFAHRREKGMH